MFKKKPIGSFIDKLKEKKTNSKRDSFDNGGTVRIKNETTNKFEVNVMASEATSTLKKNPNQKQRIFHRNRETRAGSENFTRIREHLLPKKFMMMKKKSRSSENFGDSNNSHHDASQIENKAQTDDLLKSGNGGVGDEEAHSNLFRLMQRPRAFLFQRNNNNNNNKENKRPSLIAMVRSTPANINMSPGDDEDEEGDSDDELFLDDDTGSERDDLMGKMENGGGDADEEEDDDELDLEKKIWHEIYLLDKTLEEYS